MKFLNFFKRKPSLLVEKRKYAGAAINRLTADWVSSSLSADSELYRDLKTLRNRSRELCINNDSAIEYSRLGY